MPTFSRFTPLSTADETSRPLTQKKERFDILTVSGVPAHDTLFWGLLQYGRNMWQKRPVYFLAAVKQKEEQPGSKYPNQGHAPNNLTFLHWVPPPAGADSSPLSHRHGTKPSTHSLWEFGTSNHYKCGRRPASRRLITRWHSRG